jgi:succinate dehydrogenase / fumarate reductase membrane anchor subunit
MPAPVILAIITQRGTNSALCRNRMAGPLNFTLLLAWAFTGFYHSALGLQVVIEDYVNPDWLKNPGHAL